MLLALAEPSSAKLADLVPPKPVTIGSTTVSEQMHLHTVNSPMLRTKFCQSRFFPYAVALWNYLTNEFFPSDYDLTALKGRVFCIIKNLWVGESMLCNFDIPVYLWYKMGRILKSLSNIQFFHLSSPNFN